MTKITQVDTREFFEHFDDNILSVAMDFKIRQDLPQVLSMHGGGPAGKDRVKYITEMLADNGYNGIRFDHSGHGSSSGTLQKSSLIKRYNEALYLSRYFEESPSILIGTSMAGHIAAKLTETWNIKLLILVCPAAYSHSAFDVRFDSGFSEILRQPDSWKSTDVFDTLKNYKGHSILCYGSDDGIIPKEIFSKYKEALSTKGNCTQLVLDNAPHNIHGWLNSNNQRREELLRLISEKCSVAMNSGSRNSI